MVIEGKKAEASGVRLGILNFTLQSWEGTLSFFFYQIVQIERKKRDGA